MPSLRSRRKFRFPGRGLLSRRVGGTMHPLSAEMSVVARGGPVEVRPIGDSAWLVQASESRSGAVTINEIDARTWVIQRKQGRGRLLRQVGPSGLRTHLLVDRKAARAQPRKLQKGLATFAGQEQIAWMLRELDINCVLDVGANIGQYAQQLRRTGYGGRIVSFEPLAGLAAELRKKAADDPDWQIVECALGDMNGETGINARPGAMSSLLPSSEFGQQWSARLREVHKERIQIRRLDSLYDEAVAGIETPRVYLKMDTQGYDLQTFAGAGERISEILGMQSEVSCVPIYDGMPRLPEQIATYENAGFEITGMFLVNIDRASLRVIEFDVVMIRPGARRAKWPARPESESAAEPVGKPT